MEEITTNLFLIDQHRILRVNFTTNLAGQTSWCRFEAFRSNKKPNVDKYVKTADLQ